MVFRIVWASAFLHDFLFLLKLNNNVKQWYLTASIYGDKHLDALVELKEERSNGC